MEFFRKFSSRKFLIAVAGVAMGCVAFFGLDESAVSQISGAVVSILSVVAYICGESKVDAAAVFPEVTECVEVVEENE